MPLGYDDGLSAIAATAGFAQQPSDRDGGAGVAAPTARTTVGQRHVRRLPSRADAAITVSVCDRPTGARGNTDHASISVASRSSCRFRARPRSLRPWRR